MHSFGSICNGVNCRIDQRKLSLQCMRVIVAATPLQMAIVIILPDSSHSPLYLREHITGRCNCISSPHRKKSVRIKEESIIIGGKPYRILFLRQLTAFAVFLQCERS